MKSKVLKAGAVLALFLASCSNSNTLDTDGQETEPADLPDGAFVFAGEDPERLLDQCSRGTPAPGDAYWTPSPADIVAFERALPTALAQSGRGPDDYLPEAERQGWSHFTERWTRQYIGIDRNGVRTIYGNFFPGEPAGTSLNPTTGAIIVCDGGNVFFGAEFDPTNGEIIHLAFNGRA